MAAISSSSSSSEAFSPARAHFAAEESAGTNSTVKEVQQKPSHHHFLSGRVALFLGAPPRQNGQSGMSMLHRVLRRNEAALAEVCNAIGLEEICPEHIPTNEVALTQFILKEVRSGNCKRLIRCLDAGLFSVVHDVLFFQGRFREGILEQFTEQTIETIVYKSADNGATQLLTHLLAQDPFLARVSDYALGRAFIGAAGEGHYECLLIILTNNQYLNRIGREKLELGFQNTAIAGHHKCLQALLNHTDFMAKIGVLSLEDGFRGAAEWGRFECLQALLNHTDFMAKIGVLSLGDGLRVAAGKGHFECLQALLSYDGLVDRILDRSVADGFSIACKHEHLECVQALLDHAGLLDRIPGSYLVSAFQSAVTSEFWELIELMLTCEGFLDRIPEPFLTSTFMSAVIREDWELLKTLLAHDSFAARIPYQELITALMPILEADSDLAFLVATKAQALFTEDTIAFSISILSLLNTFGLLFSTNMIHDVKTLFGEDCTLETTEQKNAFKECMTHVLLGYAREDGDSIRKQKATRFLHSIWERHGSPETDEGLDFAPNHMWDSLSVFAGAFLDCIMG